MTSSPVPAAARAAASEPTGRTSTPESRSTSTTALLPASPGLSAASGMPAAPPSPRTSAVTMTNPTAMMPSTTQNTPRRAACRTVGVTDAVPPGAAAAFDAGARCSPRIVIAVPPSAPDAGCGCRTHGPDLVVEFHEHGVVVRGARLDRGSAPRRRPALRGRGRRRQRGRPARRVGRSRRPSFPGAPRPRRGPRPCGRWRGSAR